MHKLKFAFRPTTVVLVAASAALFSACGSSGSANSTTTPKFVSPTVTGGDATAVPATTITDPETTVTTGGSATGAVFDKSICEGIADDTFSEATAADIVKMKFIGGVGKYQTVDYGMASCRYSLSDGTDITIRMLVDRDDRSVPLGEETYDAIAQASMDRTAMNEFDDEEVTGVGDKARFLDSIGAEELLVLSQGRVYLIKVRNPDDTIERSTAQDVATAGLAALT